MINSGAIDLKGAPSRVDGQPAAAGNADAGRESGAIVVRDQVVAPGRGAPVVVLKSGEPPSIAELAAARRGRTSPVEHVEAVVAAPVKVDLEATVRRFFAAFESADPAAMRGMLAPKTTYEDPVFPHLEDDRVHRMWNVVAGGGIRVKMQVDNVRVGERSAEVDWSPSYKFLGAPIVNHIHSRFTFDDQGKITQQKDSFDWRAWGNQTPFPLNLLLRTGLGQKLVQWYFGRQIDQT